jgi:hypothetical protein
MSFEKVGLRVPESDRLELIARVKVQEMPIQSEAQEEPLSLKEVVKCLSLDSFSPEKQ